MPLPTSVRVEIEPSLDGRAFVKAYWTPAALAERMLIVASGRAASPDLVATRSSLQNLLQYVYDQGRADAALGF